jgi:flagellar basal body P-ring formation protein FlgA
MWTLFRHDRGWRGAGRAMLAATIMSLLTTVQPWAAPLVELIEEKARDSAGPALPPQARFEITLQSGAPTEAVLISAWWIDPATGRFIANVVTDAGLVHRITGMATQMVAVPVPLRRLMPGEIVSPTDLGQIDLPAARLGAFAIIDPEKLVGMQVRSLLTEGRPVMVQAVMPPLVIGRGSLVTIRFSDGALELSAPGRALGDAHLGQDIRVVNLVSNTAVVGTAIENGIVEVRK